MDGPDKSGVPMAEEGAGRMNPAFQASVCSVVVVRRGFVVGVPCGALGFALRVVGRRRASCRPVDGA